MWADVSRSLSIELLRSGCSKIFLEVNLFSARLFSVYLQNHLQCYNVSREEFVLDF